MKGLPETQVAAIRAAEGCYRAVDVAREYGVNRSTVKRIWDGYTHKDVAPAEEPPNIITKPRPRDLVDDIHVMLERGMTYDEVAGSLGISKRSVFAYKGLFI